MSPTAIIHIVDDEPQVCQAIASLLEAAGFGTRRHATADHLDQTFDPTTPGCVVIDVCMPGMSGLALQEKFASANISIPIIILTGHADVSMAVEAMAKGAAGFLQKPPRSHELLELVATAVEWHRTYLEQLARLDRRKEQLELLTDRECEILRHVVDGEPSKAIAERFGISQRTVEQHRSHLMRKLEVTSIALLARFWVEAHGDTPTMSFRAALNGKTGGAASVHPKSVAVA
jgi:two-component system response regulator FixJ